jgi:hypothetical protein
VAPGWVSPHDTNLFTITDSVDEAVTTIRGFWRNYQSLRWVGDRLVIRLRGRPSDDEMAWLNDEFAGLCRSGTIERTEALPPEVNDDDELGLHRIVLRYDVRKGGGFRRMISALNGLRTAPPLEIPPSADVDLDS